MIEVFEVMVKMFIEIYVVWLRWVILLENYMYYVNNISLRWGGFIGYLFFLDVIYEMSI